MNPPPTTAFQPLPVCPKIITVQTKTCATSFRIYFIVSILSSSTFFLAQDVDTLLAALLLLCACLCCCLLACVASFSHCFASLVAAFHAFSSFLHCNSSSFCLFFSSLFSFLFYFSSCANRFCSSFSSNALIHSVLVRTLAQPVLVRLSLDY